MERQRSAAVEATARTDDITHGIPEPPVALDREYYASRPRIPAQTDAQSASTAAIAHRSHQTAQADEQPRPAATDGALLTTAPERTAQTAQTAPANEQLRPAVADGTLPAIAPETAAPAAQTAPANEQPRLVVTDDSLPTTAPETTAQSTVAAAEETEIVVSAVSIAVLSTGERFYYDEERVAPKPARFRWEEDGLRAKLDKILATVRMTWCSRDLYLAGPDPRRLQPTIMIFCESDAIAKKVKKKLREFRTECETELPAIRVKVLFDTEDPLKAALAEPWLSPSVEVSVSEGIQTICGALLRETNDPTAFCSLGGVLLVNDRLYALTTGHLFSDCIQSTVVAIMSSETPSNSQQLHVGEEKNKTGLPDKEDGSDWSSDEESTGSLLSDKADTPTAASFLHFGQLEALGWTSDRYALGQLAGGPWHRRTQPSSPDTDWALAATSSEFNATYRGLYNKSTDGSPITKICSTESFTHMDTRIRVQVLTCWSGAQEGLLNETVSSITLNRSVFTVRQIFLKQKLKRGDSGAWVLHDHKLLGMIIGGGNNFPSAYMLPIQQVLDDISACLGVVNVRLPTQSEIYRIAGQIPQHSSVSEPSSIQASEIGSSKPAAEKRTPEADSSSKAIQVLPDPDLDAITRVPEPGKGTPVTSEMSNKNLAATEPLTDLPLEGKSRLQTSSSQSQPPGKALQQQELRKLSGQFNRLIGFHATRLKNVPFGLPAWTYKLSRPHDSALYPRVLQTYMNITWEYWILATIVNGFLLSLIILGAVITALGATNSSHIAFIVLGPVVTAMAGISSYLRARGQPMRKRAFRDELGRVLEEIELVSTQFEALRLGISGSGLDDGDEWVKQVVSGKRSVVSEVTRLVELYEAAMKDNKQNHPDLWVLASKGQPTSAPSEDNYGMRLRRQVSAEGKAKQDPTLASGILPSSRLEPGLSV